MSEKFTSCCDHSQVFVGDLLFLSGNFEDLLIIPGAGISCDLSGGCVCVCVCVIAAVWGKRGFDFEADFLCSWRLGFLL